MLKYHPYGILRNGFYSVITRISSLRDLEINDNGFSPKRRNLYVIFANYFYSVITRISSRWDFMEMIIRVTKVASLWDFKMFLKTRSQTHGLASYRSGTPRSNTLSRKRQPSWVSVFRTPSSILTNIGKMNLRCNATNILPA
ncbi:MAG TPA: hypothetical protein VFF35_15335 [Bacteroidia bacterium]|nr:hypothetical protein [Bacteroidia bacterium]